jgi:hypothetical protein
LTPEKLLRFTVKPVKTDPPKQANAGGNPSVRASVSFPPQLYRTLEEIAKQKKVSLAWVVREAAEKYVEGEWPLFAKK